MADDVGSCRRSWRSWRSRFVLSAGKLVIPHTGSMRRVRAAPSRLAGRAVAVDAVTRGVWFHAEPVLPVDPLSLSVLNNCRMRLILAVHMRIKITPRPPWASLAIRAGIVLIEQ